MIELRAGLVASVSGHVSVSRSEELATGDVLRTACRDGFGRPVDPRVTASLIRQRAGVDRFSGNEHLCVGRSGGPWIPPNGRHQMHPGARRGGKFSNVHYFLVGLA